MLKEKLVALIDRLEAKDRTLPDGWKAYTVYRDLYSSLRYCLYLAVTGNHTASYVVSRPPRVAFHSPKDGWKSYLAIILLMFSGYLITDALLLLSFLNAPFEHSTGKTVIEFSWGFVWQWATRDAFGLRDVLALVATIVGLYLLNRRTKANDKQAQLAEEGLDIDRFRKGSEMLADEHMSVKHAGIVSLKHLALSRPKEYGSLVLDVFTNFLKKPDAGPATLEVHQPTTRPDIHLAFRTAMEVWQHKLIRKLHLQKNMFLDMNGIRLHGVHCSALDFQFVSLGGAHFSQSTFSDVQFNSARIMYSEFEFCSFKRVSFTGASLEICEFGECEFFDVNWNGATLFGDVIRVSDCIKNIPNKKVLEELRAVGIGFAISDLERAWICSDSGSQMLKVINAEKFHYKFLEEKCGSLRRIRVVDVWGFGD